MPRRLTCSLLLGSALTAFACGGSGASGSFGQPIAITLDNNLPIGTTQLNGAGPLLPSVIDTASALSIFPRSPGSESTAVAHRGAITLQDIADPADIFVRFDSRTLYNLPIPPLGIDTTVTTPMAILGSDALRSLTITINYAQASVTFADEIDTASRDFARPCYAAISGGAPEECVAAMRVSRRGGGTVIIDGEERTAPATRLVLPACTEDTPADVRAPLTALVATGQPVSVLASSAAERLRGAGLDVETSGSGTLKLAYGNEEVTFATIPALALVSDETRDLGACEELTRRQALADGLPPPPFPSLTDTDRDGAAVARIDAPLRVAVLADEAALFQGIRQELRPDTPDVDLILGSDILRRFTLDMDYPNARILVHCATANCVILPRCEEGTLANCALP